MEPVVLPEEEKVFCCFGCKSVYELLRDNNLCAYYSLESNPGNKVLNADSGHEYSVLDNETVLSRFTVWSHHGMRRIEFSIPGMHCSSCVWLLDRLNRFLPGITSSEVHFLRKTVTIDYEMGQVSASEIAMLLAKLGYAPILAADEAATVNQAAHQKARRDLYVRLGVAGFAFGNVMMIAFATYLAGGLDELPQELRIAFPIASLLLSVPVLLYAALPWLKGAWIALRSIPQRGIHALNLDVPVAIGMAALFVRSIVEIATGSGEGFFDSFTGLVFFLLIGRLVLQKTYSTISFDRTYRSFFPLSVRRVRDGREEVVPIEHVVVGDVLHIRNHEVLPANCVQLSSIGYFDYSFVTGESRPVETVQGQTIHAGGRVVGKPVELVVSASVNHEYLAGLWGHRSTKQRHSRYDDISERFGKWFTVLTSAIAVIAFVVWLPDLPTALSVLAAVFIIACPCALTIAAPIALGAAMSRLGTLGIYLRQPATIAEFLNIGVVAFDKTGTLTESSTDIDARTLSLSANDAAYVLALARSSTHPASDALASYLVEQFQEIHVLPECSCIEEIPGQGIRGIVDGVPVMVGKAEFVGAPVSTHGTHVVIDSVYKGMYRLVPRLRNGVLALKSVPHRILLSGDSDSDALVFKPHFGNNMRFNQRPADKVNAIREFRKLFGRVLMIGDGLNDAMALQEADVSIAVTNTSSTMAPASDVVMPATFIGAIPLLLQYARKIQSTVRLAFVFTIAYNIVGITLAVMGLLTPVLTAIMMPLSSLAVIGISVYGARYYFGRLQWQCS